ncbi:MAG: hypothetical protein IJ555_03845 [Ruminococcus sp.]|nr:hypothetical protein [Ruminococcus sp.]MBR1750644.1 hypothetical protein [Ruminococcus sp.]
MKKTTIFIIALTGLMTLSACNDASSSYEDIKDKMSRAEELNKSDTDEYVCFPDAVRLDDEEHTRELEADGGRVAYDRLGVSFELPDGFNAYIFEQDDLAEYYEEISVHPEKAGKIPKPDDPNYTCEEGIFLLNGSFPYLHEFIRVGYKTSVIFEFSPFSWYSEHPDVQIKPASTRTEFADMLRRDIEKLIPAFIANEGLDAYDYTHLDSAHKEWLELGLNLNDPDSMTEDINIAPVNNIFRTPADDSSVGDISCEQIELENGYLGVRLDYELKRHGVEMEKQVYWLLDPEADESICVMRRIEFSKDKGSQWLCSPETFLKDFDITPPDYASPYDPTDYFGVESISIDE